MKIAKGKGGSGLSANTVQLVGCNKQKRPGIAPGRFFV